MVTGEQSVVITGMSRTHKSYVVNLDILKPFFHPNKLYLTREMVTYGWIMFIAWVMKVPFRIVGTMDGIITTAITVKMHQ